jgi:TetR/AcrR family transcriptional regulator, repressor for uid operon
MRKADADLHERRRGEILAAAEACFVAKGFHQTSMQDIARASGLSMGLLYRYFDSKSAIIRAFSALDRDRMIAGIAALKASPTFVAGLARLLGQELEAMRDDDEFRLTTEVLSESTRDEVLRESFAAKELLLSAALSEAIAQQQSSGRIARDLTPDQAANLVLSMVDGLSLRAFIDRRLGKRALEELLLQSLSRLLRTSPPTPGRR